jgi:hypothetical protein
LNEVSFSHEAYVQTDKQTDKRSEQSFKRVNAGTNPTLLEVKSVTHSTVAEAPHADRMFVCLLGKSLSKKEGVRLPVQYVDQRLAEPRW